MPELHPNIFFEITRGAVSIAAWWVLFYKLHRPPTKLRRIILLASFVVGYISFMLIPLSDTGNVILWAGMIFFFALISGNIEKSLFTALYYIGIEATVDTVCSFAVRYILGKAFRGYSLEYYIRFNVQYLVIFVWTLFYYRVMVQRRGQKVPLRFWIITTIPPLITTVLLTRYADTARVLFVDGINIYFEGLLFGFFLLVLNLFTFYMYIRLLAYYDSYLKTQVMRSQLDVYTHQIQLIEGARKQTAEIRHEIKNIFFILQIELGKQNYAEVATMLNKFMGDLDRYQQKIYTGIPVIDSMIAYKAEKIKEYGATLSVGAELLDIDDTLAHDIASCLAITLDNAADAANVAREAQNIQDEKSTPYGPGFLFPVRADLWQQKNLLFIRVNNPLVTRLSYRDGELQSTKREAGHGLGLSALRRITEQYSGEVKIDDQDGIFSLRVMLLR